jgi:hypothetical protein
MVSALVLCLAAQAGSLAQPGDGGAHGAYGASGAHIDSAQAGASGAHVDGAQAAGAGSGAIGAFSISAPSASFAPARDVPAEAADAPAQAAGGAAVAAVLQGAPAPAPQSEADAKANALLLGAINAAAEGTEPFFVTVTKPVDGETVYKSAFSICGARSEAAAEGSLALYLARLNPATGLYEEFLNVDGEARVTIGLNGVFSSNVLLSEGENSFAIAVCREAGGEILASGESLASGDIQVTKFTIVCKGRSVADKISEKLKEHTLLSIIKELESAQKA